MMDKPGAPVWHELGDVAELRTKPLRQLAIGRTKIALSFADGRFGAVSGVCNHAGGPLGRRPRLEASTSSARGTTGSFTA